MEDGDFYQILDRQLITPTPKDLKKLKSLINKFDKDIFSSPRLNEIAHKNKSLYKIDVLHEILERMEKFIGEENIDSFYRNLETVTFEFENPISCKEHSDHHENGYHDSITNTIHINAETFDYLEDFAKTNNLDYMVTLKIAIAHELFHLASCNNLSDKTGFIYQGLCDVDTTKKYDNHTSIINFGKAESFNEGLTQLFACGIYADYLGDENFYKFNNTYIDQARAISQIAYMVGHKNIKAAYFNNLGMGCIKDGLSKINSLRKLYDDLTIHMARLINYNLDDKVRDTSTIKIQNVLLQYAHNYINMIDKDKINDFISTINRYFIGNWSDEVNMTLSDESKSLLEENLRLFNGLLEKKKTYKK